MVFYIIAASEKQGAKQADPAQVEAKIKSLQSFQKRGSQPTNKLEKLNIDNSQFKVGSLDMLMALNESSAKLDANLDKTCKKFEKICFETGSTELRYKDGNNDDAPISKYTDPYFCLTLYNPSVFS